MSETTPSTPSSDETPKTSAFAKLRVILLLVVLVVLLAVLFIVWNIFQSQQRGNYTITGEDLLREGVIGRIIKIGPSQPPPESTETELPTQTTSQPTTDEGVRAQQRANTTKIASGEQTYFIQTGGQGPLLNKLVVSEFDPAVGTTQGIRVEARNSQPIQSVTATLQTDTNTETYTLQLIEGQATQGVWAVQWPVTDTHDVIYTLIIEASSPGQPVTKVELAFR